MEEEIMNTGESTDLKTRVSSVRYSMFSEKKENDDQKYSFNDKVFSNKASLLPKIVISPTSSNKLSIIPSSKISTQNKYSIQNEEIDELDEDAEISQNTQSSSYG